MVSLLFGNEVNQLITFLNITTPQKFDGQIDGHRGGTVALSGCRSHGLWCHSIIDFLIKGIVDFDPPLDV